MKANENLLRERMPTDHGRMMRILNEMTERYSFLSVSYLGESMLGRGIPIVSLGEGEKSILYVGAHHGMEWITSWLLLRMVEECCEGYRVDGRIDSCNVRLLLKSRTLLIVPMLNPDGVEYQLHGVARDHFLYERVRAMNGGSEDFSRWQANARGVDLNHNYAAGFAEYKRLEAEQGILGGAPTRYSGEAPESEPEVGQLCNVIRYRKDLRMVLTLHTQGEVIYDGGANATPRSRQLARSLARLCGYETESPTGMAAYGGLTDWCVSERGIPAFTVECGRGENPLPLSDRFGIYARIRPMLFSAPFMV